MFKTILKKSRDTVFIPNGVERPVIKNDNEINKKYGLKKNGYILFLGRIVPEKQVKLLIEAYKNLETDKKLVIAGGASHTSDYFNEVKECANGRDDIIFTDFVQGEVLEELYSNAYIYVLPSDLEGMPLSLLEAMSYSNCCLTSDIAVPKFARKMQFISKKAIKKIWKINYAFFLKMKIL